MANTISITHKQPNKTSNSKYLGYKSEFSFVEAVWGVPVVVAINGVMLAVDVLVGAGNTSVITGKGTKVVVGVIVGLVEGAAERAGVLVPVICFCEMVLVDR